MIERQDIILKSAALFKRQGLKNSTMDDIASALGISKKTLYQTISDRNELIKAVINSEYNILETKLNNINKCSKNSIDQLININITVLEFLRHINPLAVDELHKQYPLIFDAAKEKFSSLFIRMLKDNLIDGIGSELYQNDIDVNIIVGIHSDRIEKFHQSSNLYEQKQSAPESIKQMVNYYIRGLVTSKGQVLLEKHINEFDKYLE